MDRYLDAIVGPPDQPYRVVDMDEFGDAVAGGSLTPAQAIEGLQKFQRFLDTHLNRLGDSLREWPDFPPRAIRPLCGWRTELFPEGAPATYWD